MQISTDQAFPADSVACCSDPITGTSLSPALPNDTGTGVPGDPKQFGY